MIHWIFNIIGILLVAALTANHVHNGGQGYGYDIPNYIYYGILAVVAFMPAFWAIAHICGGVLLGIASGGVLDGLRLGLLLGLGMAISKLWPSAFGIALGLYIGQGLSWYVYLAIAAGFLLFALDKILQYFWRVTAE